MGRAEIESFLESHPGRWFSIKEISEATKISHYAVWRVLRKNNKIFVEVKRGAGSNGQGYIARAI